MTPVAILVGGRWDRYVGEEFGLAIGDITRLGPAAVPRLTVQVHNPPAPAPIVITLAGELDGEEVPLFDGAVLALPSPGDGRDLRIEAAELTFLDSAGIRALLVFRERAEDAGARVVLGRVTAHVYRVLFIAGLIDVLHVRNPNEPH